MEGKYFVVGIVAAALIVVLGLIYMNSPSSGQTVTASGSSIIEASPDKVVIYFEAKATKNSAEDARDDIALIVENLETAMLNLVEEENIETQSYNIYEEYDWTSNSRVFKGYTASQIIKISSENFSDAGKIVDAGVDAGALVQYINFELNLEHENELKAQALEEASQDAKLKAEATAKGLGAKIGKIVSVSSSDFYYYPYRYFDAEVSEGQTAPEIATNLQPKKLEVSAYVSVVYALK
ncbi:DUF541 domain-containing protein [Candidatus Pacearchaeota archaeon]|nr:DUF541 domain-containing protein [Candidatus Pacearchaeota archaeon]